MQRRSFIANLIAGCGTLGVGIAFFRRGSRDGGAGGEVGLRPPGALPEEEFLSACIRCFRCGDACPNRAIVALNEVSGADFSRLPRPAEAGTPVIFPRKQACMLCQGVSGDDLRCTSACPTGALQEVPKTAESIQSMVAMGKASLDRNLCYSHNGSSCGVCVRACPFEGLALKAGLFEKPQIDSRYCVGCGLCERACIRYPQAIRVSGGVA